MQSLPTRGYSSPALLDKSFKIIRRSSFGAEIWGFDFKSGPTDAQVKAMRMALVEHKMLLIRDKSVSPVEQIALTRIFGSQLHSCGPSLRYLPDYPEVFRITNRKGVGNTNTGQYWHADGHYLPDPSPVTVMHIVNATSDGTTLVADTIAAYERLPLMMKTYLQQHSYLTLKTGVSHPLVRPHPLTGRMGLYVNTHATAVDDSGLKAPLIDEIVNSNLGAPGAHYEHRWEPGDTMIVDNFATAHRGTTSNPANLRIMHRTTITGASVWWRTSS